MKATIKKGMLLGLITGLISTLFDGLFMLAPNNIYIPYSYPILMTIFNIIFWITVGGLSGLFMWTFVHQRKGFKEKEGFYWALFFLFPFAIIYGLLGRYFIPLLSTTIRTAFPVYDHHLSFLWVLLIILFLITYKRHGTVNKSYTALFIPEITTFILLFTFCSNILKINTLLKCIKVLLSTITQISKPEYVQMFQGSLFISYVIGVLLISGFYFFMVSKIKLLNKKQNRAILLLCLIVPFSLATCFLINHNRFVNQNYYSIPSPHIHSPKKQPNVILIVLDTVRADRLSIYGPHGMTKNLEEIAKESVVYKNCIAPSPWTTPSHASLFTGLYPIEHGSINNANASQKLRPTPLPEEWFTLAEIFKTNGYKTGAVVANAGALHKAFQLNQGFQIYDATKSIGDIYRAYPFRPLVHLFCHLSNIYPKFIKPRRTADDITKESFRALNKLIDSPFFFFINYMDAHDPYRPPSPFDKYFLDTSFPRLYRYRQSLLNSLGKLDKKSRNAYLLSQYDGEISFLDHHLGKLFSKLKALNIYDSSLIIITSDHGELFGEHGLRFHGDIMYEEVVRIPLLIKYPFSSKRGYDESMLSLVDLYPTILSNCDLSIPDDISGKIIGHGFPPIVSELYSHSLGEHRNLYEGEYKYMAYQHQRESELYDLKKDPLEKVNLSNTLPEVSATMDKKLKDWTKNHTSRIDKHKGRSGKIFSREVEEGLKALGYISDGEPEEFKPPLKGCKSIPYKNQ